MKLLLVTWRDAVTNHSGWEKLATIAKQDAEVVRSVGWELKRTSGRQGKLTLVASVSGEDGSQDVTIPLGWIVREEELGPKKSR